MAGRQTATAAALAVLFIAALSGAAFGGNDKDAGGGYHHGASGMKSSLDAHFSDLDTDSDNAISWEEYHRHFPTASTDSFSILDKDNSGGLNHDEWHAFKEMHQGMGKGMHQKMGGHHGMMSSSGMDKYHAADLPDPSGFNAHFPDMDTGGDDRVDLEEFKAHFSGREDTQTVFRAIDLNRDDLLDHDEWHSFKKAHGLGHVD